MATQITVQGPLNLLPWTEVTREANTELGIAGLPYHIEEDKLQAHFVPCLCPALKILYDVNNTHGDLDKIMDFDAWIERVHLLDVELNNK